MKKQNKRDNKLIELEEEFWDAEIPEKDEDGIDINKP
jgi:hypothetical protein